MSVQRLKESPAPSRGEGSDGTSDASALRFEGRRALLGVLLAVALAAGAFALIGQIAQFGRLQTALTRASAAWLPACIGGLLLSYVGYLLAYRDAARASGGPRFAPWTAARIVIFGMGASVFAASVGGLAIDFWAVRRTGTKKHTAARRVLALGTIEWIVLSAYACAAAVFMLASGEHAPLAMAVTWLTVVPACVVAALWFSSPPRVGRFTKLPPRSGRADSAWPARALAGAERRARSALADAIAGVVLVRHLLAHPLRYHGGALGYPLYWAGDIFILYAGLRAFGVDPSIAPLVLAYATSFVISALPLPAGGAGGIEAGMAATLHAVGIPLAPALLAVFVYRIVTFWLPAIPALALLPSIRQLQRALSAVPHAPPDPDEKVPFRPEAETAS